MIQVYVRTPDMQRYLFSVNANMRIKEFKNHIADLISIPAHEQQIWNGIDLLQDESLMAHHNINGKTVRISRRPDRRFSQLAGAHFAVEKFSTQASYSAAGPCDAADVKAIERLLDHAEHLIHILSTTSIPPLKQESESPPILVPIITEPFILQGAAGTSSASSATHEPKTWKDQESPPILVPMIITEPFILQGAAGTSSASSATHEPKAWQDQARPTTSSHYPEPWQDEAAALPIEEDNWVIVNSARQLMYKLEKLQKDFQSVIDQYNNLMHHNPIIPESLIVPMQTVVNRVGQVNYYLNHCRQLLTSQLD